MAVCLMLAGGIGLRIHRGAAGLPYGATQFATIHQHAEDASIEDSQLPCSTEVRVGPNECQCLEVSLCEADAATDLSVHTTISAQ